MKQKTIRLFLQLLLILISCGCLLGGLNQPRQPGQSNVDRPTSGFDLLAQGIPIHILLDEGKENLPNYREQFHIRLNGVDESGVSASGFHEYLVEMDKNAGVRRELQTIESPNDYLNGTTEWVVFDGLIYYVDDAYRGGRTCKKEEISTETQSHISDYATRSLTSITPGKLIQKDVQVNGIRADVYEIDELGLLLLKEVKNVSAKVWIAKKPVYFLKAEGTVEGVVEWENRQYKGEAAFSYELKDFNQVKIRIPALCAYPPEENIPVPPNANNVRNIPNGIYYSSTDSADQVKSYYLKELASRGWVVSEEPFENFGQLLQASFTTPQDIKILIKIKIHAMGGGGSSVGIEWQARD